MTPDFCHDRGNLVHGNELLGELLPNYPTHGNNFKVKQHTVANILTVLSRADIDVPSGLRMDAAHEASDAFVGYLMLDALIGNTDSGDGGPLSPLEVFDVIRGHRPAAARWWLHRLASIQPGQFDDLINHVPTSRISDVGRRFASRVLHLNHARLLARG